MATMAQLGRLPTFSEPEGIPPAGPARQGCSSLDAAGQLAQGRPPPGEPPAAEEAGRGPRRHDPTAWEPERDGCNPPEFDSTWYGGVGCGLWGSERRDT